VLGSGHWPQFSQPQRLGDAIAAAITRTPPRPRRGERSAPRRSTDAAQCPMPRPPSTGMTAPEM
jgi:hypothetical protein